MSSGVRCSPHRLDGCTGLYARDASLPDAVVFEAIEDKPVAAAARAAVLASGPANGDAGRLDRAGSRGRWDEDSEITTQVLRASAHRRDVGVRARPSQAGCGDVDVNVWGLFRVDASGKLDDGPASRARGAVLDHRLIDVDGDGEPELLGRPWLGLELVLDHANGAEIDSLPLPVLRVPLLSAAWFTVPAGSGGRVDDKPRGRDGGRSPRPGAGQRATWTLIRRPSGNATPGRRRTRRSPRAPACRRVRAGRHLAPSCDRARG